MDDWVKLLAAIGTLATVIAGALGVWWLRIMAKRNELEINKQEVAAKLKKEETASDRKNRKDTIEELYRILDTQRKDRDEDRKTIDAMRIDMTAINIKLATCEAYKDHLEERIDDMTASIEKAGIKLQFQHPSNTTGQEK